MRKPNNVAFLIIVLAGLLIVLSCGQTELAKYGDLKNRVREYYELEKNGQWEQAYLYRTPSYKRSVSRQLYISSMQEDNAGWKLESFDILDVKEKEGKVYLEIKFIETAPRKAFPKEVRDKLKEPVSVERIENSVWINIDGNWFVYDAASRSRLSLNVPLGG